MDTLDEAVADITRPPWGELGRTATFGVVSGFCKLLLQVFNTTTMQNLDSFHDAVRRRPSGTPLITICNHTSTLDDPALLCAMLPWSFYWTEHKHHQIRWSLCAREMCFRNEFLRQFFLNGKTLPIDRGQGVDQPVLRVAAGLLRRGDWVHVFPEGRVHFSGQLGPMKWGVGKLVCEAKRDSDGKEPIVLPFYHTGMGEVLPMNSLVPRVGKHVNVNVGEPLDLTDVTCKCNQPGVDQKEVWKEITLKMRDALAEMQRNSPPNVNQIPDKDLSQQPALDSRPVPQ